MAAIPSVTAADYLLPFSFTPSEETLAECTVIDGADPGETGYGGAVSGKWFFSGSPQYAFKYSYLSTAADDWLILPAVDFGDCKKVKVSFQIETYNGSYEKENFSVKLGHGTTADDMTVDVMTKTGFKQYPFGELSAEVTVPDDASAIWNLGFHATSEGNQGWIYIKDIKIENAETGAVAVVPAAPVVKTSAIAYLDYTATVTMPSLDTDGTALSGNMSLNVLVDGTVSETKSDCAPGADVEVALKLAAGEHTIGYQAVFGSSASQAATETVVAKEHVIVPAAPSIVECTANFLKLSATVTMPDKDTDGNAVVSSNLSLDVLIDGIVVETKNRQTAGDNVAVTPRTLSAGKHTIGFRAILNGEKSEIVTAEVNAVEQVFILPFEFNPSTDNLSDCVEVDAAGDGNAEGNGKWTVNDGAFLYTYHSSNDADDWIILPLVDFGDATKVKVSISAKTLGFPEGFELKLGAARTVAAMTIPVMSKTDYQSPDKDYETLSATVELPAGAPAIECLGIHAISEKDKYQLYIKEIKIERADMPVVVPAAPVIKESSVNALEYNAIVTMPAVATDGAGLTGAMSLEVIVDDNVEETIADCASGSDVSVSLSLDAGEHTVGYRAVLGEQKSDVVSETVTAASVTTGGLPFTFEVTENAYSQCLIVDLSGSDQDPYTGDIKGAWSYSAGNGFKYTYNQDKAADDWVILPLVDFGESSKVKVSFDVMTDYDTESFELCLGRERTVEAMNIPVISKTDFVSNNKWTTLSAEVDVPTALTRAAENNFAVGIHATSPANHYLIYINNIKIESVLTTTGIGDVEIDGDAKVEYYDLQGVRVENPAPGIYIVRKGDSVSKVLVR